MKKSRLPRKVKKILKQGDPKTYTAIKFLMGFVDDIKTYANPKT